MLFVMCIMMKAVKALKYNHKVVPYTCVTGVLNSLDFFSPSPCISLAVGKVRPETNDHLDDVISKGPPEHYIKQLKQPKQNGLWDTEGDNIGQSCPKTSDKKRGRRLG